MEYTPANWSLEDVVSYVRKAANALIANRQCKFDIGHGNDAVKDGGWLEMMMQTDHCTEKRSITYYPEDNTMELLDLLMVKLTHMAVACGLIETTPKQLTHHVNISGSDWMNAEVQLDGHTLRGVYSAEYKIKAGEEPELKLGFSRSQIHLDQNFLPRNMKIEIEGMEKTLLALRSLCDLREEGFKNKETGEQYARLHSSDEEVEIYRNAYDVLTLYEAVLDGDPIVEVESNRMH